MTGPAHDDDRDPTARPSGLESPHSENQADDLTHLASEAWNDPADLSGHANSARESTRPDEALVEESCLDPYSSTKTFLHTPGVDLSVPGLVLPQRIGRYEFLSEMARGGMGVIYLAHDRLFQRVCAVKALLPEHAHKPEFRKRFLAEVYITARLEHPGIVPIYDVGDLPDGRPYFSMRIIPGQTLSELIAELPMPTGRHRLLSAFEAICQALAYAHSHHVLHRDLKPANVIVEPYGVVKVLDWGLAKVLPSSPLSDIASDTEYLSTLPADLVSDDLPNSTRVGLIMGTVAYLAPEQVRGELDRVDKRADVFGLGAILCEILTGRPPYDAGSPKRTLSRALKVDLTDAFERLDRSGADAPLISLAKRCLAKEPEQRPADAGVLAQELVSYFEADTRRAEHDLVRFFELSLDLFCIAGLDGYFRRVNNNFSRLLGHDVKDLLSRPFLSYVHPEDHQRTQTMMEKLQRGEPVVRFRNRYRDVNGAYRWFEWTAKVIPEEGLVFAVARDVTPAVDEDWPQGAGI